MAENTKHLWVVMGPAGCGKTVVGKYLASQFKSSEFVEGDFHRPGPYVYKDEFHEPLTEDDFIDWLEALTNEAIHGVERSRVVFVSCSALKRAHRSAFRMAVKSKNDDPSGSDKEPEAKSAAPAGPKIELHFLYLEMELSKAKALVDERHCRENHYMKASMVSSQYAILELPRDDEGGTVSVVKNDGTVEDVQRNAFQEVKRVMAIN